MFENKPSVKVEKKDISIARDLVKRAYEIQDMAEKIQLWKDHN